MMTVTAALSLLALAAQAPQQVDSIRALARASSEPVQVAQTRRQPDAAREALRQLLAAGAGVDSSAVAAFAPAERLARAWALAWQDSFYVREVSGFRSLSREDRQATLAADSVLQAGNVALRNIGIDAAMRAWRESLRRYDALADTAGVAAALVRLGDGFRRMQAYDSAEVHLARARVLAERIGDYRTLGNALGLLAGVKTDRSEWGLATELYAQARPIRERTGDAVGLARDQNGLGNMARMRDDVAGARRAYEAALAAFRSVGDTVGAASPLWNLGSLAMQVGDYAESAARYREALWTFKKVGDRARTAGVLRNLGLLARRRGDYAAALAALSEAGTILRQTGPESDELDVRVMLADARADMGDLQGARTDLARADALAKRLGGVGLLVAELALFRGDFAFKFNRLAEAEREYARSQRLAPGPDFRAVTVRTRAQLGLAMVQSRRRNYRHAEAILNQVVREESDLHRQALARVMLGDAAWRGGNIATARRAFGNALETLRTLDAVTSEAEALGILGRLEAEAGRAPAAESLYHRGLTRLGRRPAPAIAWQLHAGLAGTLRSRGALGDAAGRLRTAVAEIERISGTLPLEELRSAFRADKWGVYVDLALIEWSRGRTAAAFEVSERLRARQMLDLMARGRVAAAGVATEDLASREQDLRRKMAELTRQLEDPGERKRELRGRAGEEVAGPVREALAQAQEAYGELLLKMREANPAYAALVAGEIAPAREVMTALDADEALLEYLVGDSTTIVFVVTSDTIAALDLRMSHDVLRAEVDFARATLARAMGGTGQQRWRAPMRRLYRKLVAPAEASGLLEGKRRLLIVPHGELHYLPFAALVRPDTPEQLLVERYIPQYLPSASVWLRLRGRAPPRSGGVLALAPRTAALPGSRAEVAAIRQTFGGRAQTLHDAQATEPAFRELAPEQEIVHLASHGVLNKHNPLFSFIELNAGGEHDGRLEVHEVFGLSLKARLVVLSACQTGVAAGALGDVPPGDDWVGLVQGFLFAGAGNVLAALWPVSDVATARLMELFYQELGAGRSEADSLARAQRAALRAPATAHPFFWAGFTLVRGR